MRLLLDTHVLLWWWTNDARLSASARQAIAEPSHEILVSAASAWEIATKHRLGKLTLPETVVDRYTELVVADGFTHLPISALHALRAGATAHAHRDPFDRMLAAQSLIENVPLVTADPALATFEGPRFW